MAAIRWHIRFFGGLLLLGPGRAITHFRSQKTAALLAHLAYHRGRSFPREVLTGLLWPGPATAGRHSLSTALSSLRHQLELPGLPAARVLIADPYCVALSTETTTTDVSEFKTALLCAERASSADERIRALQQAVELYQGEFLPGFYDDWVLAEQLAHSERFVKALCDLTVLLEKRKEHVAALDYARRATQADPLREEPYQEIMRLYAAMGEPGAALRYYRELVRVFRQELGEEPSASSQALAKKIAEGLALPVATAPAKRSPARTGSRAAAARMTPVAPAGTLTFLLMDSSCDAPPAGRTGPANGSQQLETVLRREIRTHGGHAGTAPGHPLLGVFIRAADAASCAIAGQAAAARRARTGTAATALPRMAIHTGDAEPEGNTYSGPVVDHVADILAATHAGQILCSEATARLLRPLLDGGALLRGLGVYRVAGSASPEHLHQIEHPDMARREFPPPRAANSHPSNLPLRLPPFFGREDEIRFLSGMLSRGDSRLVTLVGPPGVGKSRLALETAARLLPSFGGAVWHAALAGTAEPARVPEQVLAALAVPRDPDSDARDQVLRVLADERGLLLLDDLEPQPATVHFVRNLLADCPGLTLLVISREKLRLPGERELNVAPLPCRADRDTAAALGTVSGVQLLVDRVQAVEPGFRLTDENAPLLADLCRHLGGFPLAIELAAPRIPALGVHEALDVLTRALDVSARGQTLGAGDCGTGDCGAGDSGTDNGTRHRSLRAALDWSYNHLSPDLRRFFARLAVFRDGWTAEAAERVCGEPMALDYLADLTDCSLIAAEQGPRHVRFRMLEPIRDYAREQLQAMDDAEVARSRHCGYFLDLAERAAAKLGTPDAGEWRAALEADHDNLRAAIDNCGATDSASCRNNPCCMSLALGLAVALQRFWLERGDVSYGRRILESLLAAPGAPRQSQLHAEALGAAGVLAREQGDAGTALRYLESSLVGHREHDDPGGTARVLRELGILFARQGRASAARDHYHEALSLAAECRNRHLEAEIRGSMGLLALAGHEWAAAGMEIERALAILRACGDRAGVAIQLANLAAAWCGQGQPARAEGLLRESLAIRRELGDRIGAGRTLAELASARLRAGDRRAAGQYLVECLATARDLTDRRLAARALDGLVELDRAATAPESAALMSGAAAALRQAAGATAAADAAASPAQTLSEVQETLGRPAFDRAVDRGRTMSFEAIVTRALERLQAVVDFDGHPPATSSSAGTPSSESGSTDEGGVPLPRFDRVA